MRLLSREQRKLILRCLVEGMSVRSTSRTVDVSKQAILRLLGMAGTVSARFHDERMRDLSCERIEVDEIWAFVHTHPHNLEERREGMGDVWTWVALDPDTKLVVSWLVGDRSTETAIEFLKDVSSRLSHKVQLSTDGYLSYPPAVEEAFGANADHTVVAHLQEPQLIQGSPHEIPATTSHVERQNLTMRMSMRRFTRKTNAFSKKIENHAHSVALHYMFYNWCRIHQSLKVTPAMETGLTDRLWELEDIVDMIEELDPKPGPRGPYKKKAQSDKMA